MIRGYFVVRGATKRPYVNALVEFPQYSRHVSVPFLIDTGADRSTLAADDLARAGVTLTSEPPGLPSTGVGGTINTRVVDTVVTLGSLSVRTRLLVLEGGGAGPRPAIPSLLGRDLLAHFALLVDARSDRVLLLEPDEADALPLP